MQEVKEAKIVTDFEEEDYENAVSASQIMQFMSCRQKWAYGYKEGLRPKVEKAYLTVGKLCHTGMESAWRSIAEGGDVASAQMAGVVSIEDAYAAYAKENCIVFEDVVQEMPDFDRVLADARNVFCHAWRDIEPERYRVVRVDGIPALELHFRVPLEGNPAGLHGYIDAVLEDTETGHIWCTDYKFRKSLDSHDKEDFNIQNTIYMNSLRLLGIHVTGTWTFQHLNTPPMTPKVNRDGTISRSKIRTTWERYCSFCEENGQDPADYAAEMIPKLSDIEWSRSTREYRNDDTVSRMWGIVVDNALEIAGERNRPRHTRSMYPWNCQMCQFSELCQAELRGHDARFLREESFIVDR